MSDAPIRRVRGLNEPPAAPEASQGDASPPAADLAQPPARTPRPRPGREEDEAPTRRQEDVDADLDRALEAQFSAKGLGVSTNFKREKDDDIEAELEEMLSGFDPDSLTVGKGGRTRGQDRAGQPKPGIGQEDRHGLQRAKVVGIKSGTVFLDLGAKSEGVVPLEQFEDAPPSVGETVEVIFERYDREEGLLVMSRKGAAVIATWDNLKKGLTVEARVTKEIKGGLEVEVNGIRGFLPVSQIELGRVEDLKPYINQKLKCVVTEANQRERNLVVSRRDLLEQERAEQREKTWAELEVGQTRSGVVRNVKDFGAFVDLGGVDGLILVSNLAWGRVGHPSEVVSLGQKVEVQVLSIDRETQKISLGLKQLKASPWDTAYDKYDVGQHVEGKVTRVMEFGAFVELEPGIEGLIHISEMGPKKVWRTKDVVKEGETVAVRILKFDPDEKRISLSLKPLPAEPLEVEEEDETAAEPVKPKRLVPLKGGLGDRDPNPFASKPAKASDNQSSAVASSNPCMRL